MHWRLGKYVTESCIDYLRRLFTYNTTWANAQVEFVKFDEGKGELFYESFFQGAERYPIVILEPGGGQFVNQGINDFVREVDDDKVDMGIRPLQLFRIDDINIIKSTLPTLDGIIARGIDLSTAWTGEGIGGDDIHFTIYENYFTTPVVKATGSVPGHTSKAFVNNYIEFGAPVVFSGNPYHLVMSSTAVSPYYVAIDNTTYKTYYDLNNVPGSGSVVGSLRLPGFLRLGGNYKGTLNIKVSSKNDSKTAYNLSELISIYMNLGKHGTVNRTNHAIDGILSSLTDASIIPELMNKGITIGAISVGGLEKRKRSDQEVIFSLTVSVEFLTEWFEDYPVDSITDIKVLVNTFFEGPFNGSRFEVDI